MYVHRFLLLKKIIRAYITLGASHTRIWIQKSDKDCGGLAYIGDSTCTLLDA